MPITKIADEMLTKEASPMKLPEYLKKYLERGPGKGFLRKGLSGVGKTLQMGGRIGSPIAKKVGEGISATGRSIYHHPKKTLVGGTVAGYGLYNAQKSLGRNLNHVNPNRDVTTTQVPQTQVFGNKITSPIPFRSIKYKTDNLEKTYGKNYNLF
jgi:hypothetical protein